MGRALLAATSLPGYPRALYSQHGQMARFLTAYYPGATIAINDIGLINFTTNFHCTDLWGLANSDVFAARRAGTYSTDFLSEETAQRGVEIAVIYDAWFSNNTKTITPGPAIPASWIRVRRWRAPQLEQLGDRTVSFYALTPGEAVRLKTHLEAFEKSLPSDVAVLP